MTSPTAAAETSPDLGTDTRTEHEPVQARPLEVKVDDRGVDRAIRKLRRMLSGEGILRELKRRRHYEKPSIAKKRKGREAERRRKRRDRKAKQELMAQR